MLKALFKLDSRVPHEAQARLTGMDEQLMVDLLCNAGSLMPFTPSEAKVAASYLLPRNYQAGEVIIEEGSRIHLDQMLWILQGEAVFEAMVGAGPGKSVTLRVLGPGAELGTMSMFDGQPRTLRGVASGPLRCARLTRSRLRALCKDHPPVGNKLMAVMCLNFSQSLRELTAKLKTHIRLNNVLSTELRRQAISSFDAERSL